MSIATQSHAAAWEVVSTPWYRQRTWRRVGFAAAVLLFAQVVLSNFSAFVGTRPNTWNVNLADPVDTFQSWVRSHRDTNPVLANVLRPISDFVIAFYESLRDLLSDLPWFWLALLVALVILRSGKWLTALGAAAGLLFIELAGYHKAGMETVALMLICVVLSIAIGLPLGIWAGLNPAVERFLRPILDALQSIPSTIFLVAAVLLFGILQTPAVIATVLFAVPPMIRIIALGIRQVPTASVEAGQMFGSSKWQLLWKVQAPQAMQSFVTAVNQTIMMCLGLVVIGALVGAGGLGAELLATLRLRSPGRGFIVGLAIFGIAVAFDRLSRSLVDRASPLPVPARTYWAAVAVVLVAAYAIGRGFDAVTVPWTFDADIAAPIDDLVTWIRDHLGDVLQSINDFIVRDIVIRIRELLGTTLAWPGVVAATAAAGWMLKGWRFAAFCIVGLTAVGLTGMWEPSVETLAQVLVAVAISVLIAVPLGIFIGRRPRVESFVEPVLDALQTFPNLIYAIPFVMVFSVGYVPGILATVLYAVPAGIRLTALSIRQVNPETLEAASTFGATDRQRLWGVQVPLALKGIALGINQVIMMAMSMVIIAGLVGGQGLGYLAVTALIAQDSGLGAEVGVAMLVMAIVLDRLSEGVAERLDPASTSGGSDTLVTTVHRDVDAASHLEDDSTNDSTGAHLVEHLVDRVDSGTPD